MKKTISFFLTLMLMIGVFSLPVMAADEKPERGTLRYTEIIAPQYEAARQFYDGLAAVKKDGKWGYIDTDNKVVIPFQYDFAFDFNEGFAIVMPEIEGTYPFYEEEPDGPMTYEGKLGFVDTHGTYTPFTWSSGSGAMGVLTDESDPRFHNGYACIQTVGVSWAGFMAGPDGKVIETDPDARDKYYLGYYPVLSMNEGLCAFGSYGMGGGWMDADAKIVKQFPSADEAKCAAADAGRNSYTYIDDVYPFNQGLAPVYEATVVDTDVNSYGGDVYTYKIGFMDRSMNWAIEPQYDSYFWNDKFVYQIFGTTGLAMVAKDGLYGAIDKNNNTVIPFRYDELWPVNGGMICFKENDRYGYLDAESYSQVIAPQYVKASGFSDQGLAAVYDGSKAFLIDKKGNSVPGSDALDPSTYFRTNIDGSVITDEPQEYVVVNKNGKFGFGHIEYDMPLPDEKDVDSWAHNEVTSAIEAELIPASMQNLYRQNITRSEFCSLIVEMLKVVEDQPIEEIVLTKTGKELTAWQQEYPYYDVSDRDVIAATALGIINGRGDGVFDPYSSITRQEAATMLMRAAKLLALAPGQAVSFNDTSSLQAWAKDGIDYVSGLTDPTTGNKVMGGTGSDQFSPTATYTREQAYLTILRLHNCAEN